jgi:hypothetical protein
VSDGQLSTEVDAAADSATTGEVLDNNSTNTSNDAAAESNPAIEDRAVEPSAAPAVVEMETTDVVQTQGGPAPRDYDADTQCGGFVPKA